MEYTADNISLYVILLPPFFGLLWSAQQAYNLSKIKLNGPAASEGRPLTDPLNAETTGSIEEQLASMKAISASIAQGADAFLFEEFRYIFVYMIFFSALLCFAVGPLTMLSFICGGATSLLCGYIGMRIAVYANVRTCHQSWLELEKGFKTALQAGSIMGFSVVSLSILSIFSLIIFFRLQAVFGTTPEMQPSLFEALAGYGLGGSSIALFARVGGGIYTKAADIGADLSGKNEYGIPEDDPRNPACIADNVGDNVGDIAGMGADLFGSLAEATCASLVLASAPPASSPAAAAAAAGSVAAGSTSGVEGISSFLFSNEGAATAAAAAAGTAAAAGAGGGGGAAGAGAGAAAAAAAEGLSQHFAGLMFPIVISSLGIVGGCATVYIVRRWYSVRAVEDIEKSLKAVLFLSTVVQTPLLIAAAYAFLPAEFAVLNREEEGQVFITYQWRALLCVLLGLWGGLGIGLTTEYYTSHSYRPVREISAAQQLSAATGIIYGLSLGYLSVVIPIICLAVCICCAQALCGVFGVSLTALGMLSTLPVCLMIDAFGPVSDNAGGIAQMSGLAPEVREKTDALDAAGNTTAAVGKGYAIGSAALVSLALFCAYTVRAKIKKVDILDVWSMLGLIIGAMIPYLFSSLTIKSVGNAANEMVKECLEQFPYILQGSLEPQYKRCIEISTKASLKEMILPALLVILSPILIGFLFGKNTTAGFLIGNLLSGLHLALSMTNAGGAWDNAKKYIESGALGPNESKGSSTHKNAVVGDTVGDPLKDTSGPSLNILIKLSAIISLIFANFISTHFSNPQGGPVWI